MKKFAIPILAASMVMNAGLAFAWSDVTGTIKSMDVKTHEMTLDNGETYMLENTVNPLVFKVGDKVTVTTQIENNKNMVNKVVKVG